MIAGAVEEEVPFRSQLGVIEQSFRDCAVQGRLPLALGGAVVARTRWLRSSGLSVLVSS